MLYMEVVKRTNPMSSDHKEKNFNKNKGVQNSPEILKHNDGKQMSISNMDS